MAAQFLYIQTARPHGPTPTARPHGPTWPYLGLVITELYVL
jgi:hypothetical protein